MPHKRLRYTKADLRIDLEIISENRRERAANDPTDKMSLPAANLLDRLVESAEAVDPALITAFDDLFEDSPDLDAYRGMLWEIGITLFPANATEFVKTYIARRSGAPCD